MKTRQKLIFYTCAVLLAAAFAGLLIRHSEGAPRVLLHGALILLLLAILLMALALRKSLKVTLYSYANIGLIGGIIFAGVLTGVVLGQVVRCHMAGDFSQQYFFNLLLDFPHRFSLYAVIFISVLTVLLAVSNVALIRHEGFCLQNALSILVAAFYMGGTALAYVLSDILEKYVFVPKGIAADKLFMVLNTVIPMFFLLMLSYFECILLGSLIMGWKAAKTSPSLDKDYIIILGCSIDKRGGLLPLLKGRVNRAIRFAWEQEIKTGKPMHYVPSGGQGPNEVMSEGSAMELYLMSRGAEDYEIFPEKKSRNTWENMTLSKEVVDGLKPGAKVAFATTNYHILRSGILARRAGLDAEGIAGDTKWYFWPNGFVREFFGILSLNIRAHAALAVIIACVCAVVGVASYFA